jgi:hypothetical protein
MRSVNWLWTVNGSGVVYTVASIKTNPTNESLIVRAFRAALVLRFLGWYFLLLLYIYSQVTRKATHSYLPGFISSVQCFEESIVIGLTLRKGRIGEQVSRLESTLIVQ